MAIYFMDGRTFLKKYINEDLDVVLRTQYVLASSTLRSLKSDSEFKTQIIRAGGIIYPETELIINFDDYEDELYKEGVISQFRRHEAFFATIIRYALEEEYTIVILCAPHERRFMFLEYLQEYLDERFGYHIYDYKKFKKGKDPVRKQNTGEILELCDSILKNAKKEEKKRMLASEHGREKYFGQMKKKDLKKELIKRGLYIKDMSPSEMREMLDLFV